MGKREKSRESRPARKRDGEDDPAIKGAGRERLIEN